MHFPEGRQAKVFTARDSYLIFDIPTHTHEPVKMCLMCVVKSTLEKNGCILYVYYVN